VCCSNAVVLLNAYLVPDTVAIDIIILCGIIIIDDDYIIVIDIDEEVLLLKYFIDIIDTMKVLLIGCWHRIGGGGAATSPGCNSVLF
jgi:hypothetical protein